MIAKILLSMAGLLAIAALFDYVNESFREEVKKQQEQLNWNKAINDLSNISKKLNMTSVNDPLVVIDPAIQRLTSYARSMSGYKEQHVKNVIFKLSQFNIREKLSDSDRADLALMIEQELAFNFLNH